MVGSTFKGTAPGHAAPPTPVEADPTGEAYCFERRARKDTGGDGWADVWKRHHFAWEYKGRRADLDAAFEQLRQYSLALENPPLLILDDIVTAIGDMCLTFKLDEINALLARVKPELQAAQVSDKKPSRRAMGQKCRGETRSYRGRSSKDVLQRRANTLFCQESKPLLLLRLGGSRTTHHIFNLAGSKDMTTLAGKNALHDDNIIVAINVDRSRARLLNTDIEKGSQVQQPVEHFSPHSFHNLDSLLRNQRGCHRINTPTHSRSKFRIVAKPAGHRRYLATELKRDR